MFSVFYRICFYVIHRVCIRLFVVVIACAGLSGCGFKGDPYYSSPSNSVNFKDLDDIGTRLE